MFADTKPSVKIDSLKHSSLEQQPKPTSQKAKLLSFIHLETMASKSSTTKRWVEKSKIHVIVKTQHEKIVKSVSHPKMNPSPKNKIKTLEKE